MKGLCWIALIAAALVWAAPARGGTSDVTLEGVLDFRKPTFMVVDGQRVQATPSTVFKGAGAAKNPASIPLGYMMKVKGTRDATGTVIASQIETRPNVIEGPEAQIIAGSNLAESTWVAAGKIVEQGQDGKEQSMGALHSTGAQVDRVRRIVDRVMPSYIDRSKVRIYVVDNPEWNAMAMANYSIYVFSGLLADMSDDEVALVLGHEMTHATYEHSRRQASKSQVSGIAGQLAMLGASRLGNSTAKAIAQNATSVAYSTFNNKYSRTYEDQADRVGMRYAYEAGFDITKAPNLWRRFTEKYGESSKVQNFVYGNHSLSGARAQNLTREIQNNYAAGKDTPSEAPATATKSSTTTKTTSTTTKSTTTTTKPATTTTKPGTTTAK